MGVILAGCSKSDNNGTNTPDDPDPDPTPEVVCDGTKIRAQWSLDGGESYEEAADDKAVTVEALNGYVVHLSMQPAGVPFTISFQGVEVYSGSDEYVLGEVDQTDMGDYIITTNQDCSTTITLNVTDVPCDDNTLRAEWSLDGGQSYQEAPDNQPITVEAFTGDRVRLSVQPAGVVFTITYQGVQVYSGSTDYILGVVNPSNNGDYIINANEECSTTITLNVTNVVCDGSTMRAEWSLDNGLNYTEAPDNQPVTVDATTGDQVRLSMQPAGITFSVTYEGVEVYHGFTDYILGAVDPSDSGDYIIFSDQECTTTITLNVTDGPCDASTLRAEWSFDNGVNYIEAPDNLPVIVEAASGADMRLSMVPNGTTFSMTLPDGSVVDTINTDYFLGVVDTSHSGRYIISLVQGCSTSIFLNVDCLPDSITPEYTVDGVPASGSDSITVSEGAMVSLATVQGGTFTVTRPDGSSNTGTLDIGAITQADAGLYFFTSDLGCSASLMINVQ